MAMVSSGLCCCWCLPRFLPLRLPLAPVVPAAYSGWSGVRVMVPDPVVVVVTGDRLDFDALRADRDRWAAFEREFTEPGASGRLERALAEIPALREEFWSSICLCGGSEEFNVVLEKAGRVADYLEFAEVMIRDALTREESCGAHFRQEYQTADGEALRNDNDFAHVAAWGFQGDDQAPQRATEALAYEHLQPAERNYR